MYLTDAHIIEISKRPGINDPYSVIQFLTGLHKGINFKEAILIAEMDAISYKWNKETILIICDCIDYFYSQLKFDVFNPSKN